VQLAGHSRVVRACQPGCRGRLPGAPLWCEKGGKGRHPPSWQGESQDMKHFALDAARPLVLVLDDTGPLNLMNALLG